MTPTSSDLKFEWMKKEVSTANYCHLLQCLSSLFLLKPCTQMRLVGCAFSQMRRFRIGYCIALDELGRERKKDGLTINQLWVVYRRPQVNANNHSFGLKLGKKSRR